MDTVDIIGLLVPVTYFLFLITEKLWPAREFPPRKGWQWIGIGFLVLISTISVVVPLLIPDAWLDAHRWLDGTRLGVVGGTLVGYVRAGGRRLRVAPHRAQRRLPVARLPPDPPQPAARRHRRLACSSIRSK